MTERPTADSNFLFEKTVHGPGQAPAAGTCKVIRCSNPVAPGDRKRMGMCEFHCMPNTRIWKWMAAAPGGGRGGRASAPAGAPPAGAWACFYPCQHHRHLDTAAAFKRNPDGSVLKSCRACLSAHAARRCNLRRVKAGGSGSGAQGATGGTSSGAPSRSGGRGRGSGAAGPATATSPPSVGCATTAHASPPRVVVGLGTASPDPPLEATTPPPPHHAAAAGTHPQAAPAAGGGGGGGLGAGKGLLYHEGVLFGAEPPPLYAPAHAAHAAHAAVDEEEEEEGEEGEREDDETEMDDDDDEEAAATSGDEDDNDDDDDNESGGAGAVGGGGGARGGGGGGTPPPSRKRGREDEEEEEEEEEGEGGDAHRRPPAASRRRLEAATYADLAATTAALAAEAARYAASLGVATPARGVAGRAPVPTAAAAAAAAAATSPPTPATEGLPWAAPGTQAPPCAPCQPDEEEEEDGAAEEESEGESEGEEEDWEGAEPEPASPAAATAAAVGLAATPHRTYYGIAAFADGVVLPGCGGGGGGGEGGSPGLLIIPGPFARAGSWCGADFLMDDPGMESWEEQAASGFPSVGAGAVAS